MEFSIKSGTPEKQRKDCVVVGVFEARKFSDAAAVLDRASQGYLGDILRTGDIDGKPGSTLLLHSVPGVAAGRVLLVGLGKERELDEHSYRKALRAAIKALHTLDDADVAICLAEVPVKKRDTAWRVAQVVEIAEDSTYRFDRFKSKPANGKKGIAKLQVHVTRRSDVAEGEKGLRQGKALAAGVSFAKDLGNLAPNYCTPSYLAEQAEALSDSHGLQVEVLEKEDIEKLGMGSFLGVTKGSVQPPKLIVLQHRKGKKSQKPVVLVGKGITFDTGGISLKPGADMDEMKYDMCGAASVLGTFKAIAELDLPLNVVGIIPTCENMPDGNATRPGDVLTSMSGQTIEVLNTDAEGRLILCDALTYAERFEPQAVVDVATLTGACVIALGHHASGLFSNKDSLAEELLDAGNEAYDRAWRLPLWDDYQSQLDSNFADMANIGGRAGGSITAACFLSRFAKKYDWAHLDIAGTAWKSGKEKGATGRPVPLLTEFLKQRAGK
ncbi:leucyl aminopeptidase [Methylobacillus flagellatus]|uniref:Probable cytosol aminopeptidase n=1 Tax=Methylobacillus flagellatus (strain ATCC 51484 / DSM 6875 / VKM B-1610 / KT) TaxID=265072 RepID=AMPA_METFK|nr:leucyl aminopeptidase [Methylobacillus flagellatus]Q1H4U4.1 RecName: Full=Probable cytosol aminopeptidase; AltName: Full=Leucine aminopeptidase; Short=LAP; AltName: Full=Leucyl aminopeptidase [Methylobacillus flagellatus KT]ABE48493.1 aminopeptidase A, Metallo peptidase, MEROPS family M17 [Methylobacillus flagellatus KT]